MAGHANAVLPVAQVDEAKLLNDCRSPRFLKACQKLQIDPLELRPRELESFEEPGVSPAKQQARFAMYERSRLAKWNTINDTRFSLPKGDGLDSRSKSAELFRTSTDLFVQKSISWLPSERARTMQQIRNGRQEVVKITAKRLRDITAVGDYSEKERAENKQKEIEAKMAAERKRKEIIKRDQEKEQARKDRLKKEWKDMKEREEKQREFDANMESKLRAMREAWENESKEKQRKQEEHHEKIARNREEIERKQKEEQDKLIHDFERKESQVQKMRESVFGSEGNVGAGAIQQQAAEAQKKRDDILKAAEARSKHLLSKHLVKEAQTRAKELARLEKLKESAKEKKEREQAARRRMAEIQKKKEDILRDRENKVLEHMEKVEENLKANKERLQKELELKAEVEKLKLDQALENVRREKARQRQEQRELKELHDDLSSIKKVRDEALDKLKRERQLQATKIRLHKDELREEVFLIQVQNSWNKAFKMLNT